MKPDSDPQQHIAHATRKAFVEGVLASRGRAEVLGLVGASGAYLLAGLLAASSETLLVVTATQQEAARLAADLAFCHGRGGEIFLFPHWEVGPYEPLQPHPEVEAERLAALAALHEGRARALVVPVRALLQRVIPREVLAGLCERLQVEEEYPRPPLLQRLVELGYQAVPLVEDRGTFSVRGDLLDIFPPTRATPVRIEFFGDYIERMRPFDPASQRSSDQELEELMLLPARELVLAGEHLETFSRKLKERCDLLGLPRSVREEVLEEAREGILAPGRSFLLPCNYARLDALPAYAPQARWVVIDPPAVVQEADRFSAEVHDGEARAARRGEPFVAPAELFLDAAELEAELARRPRIDFSPSSSTVSTPTTPSTGSAPRGTATCAAACRRRTRGSVRSPTSCAAGWTNSGGCWWSATSAARPNASPTCSAARGWRPISRRRPVLPRPGRGGCC